MEGLTTTLYKGVKGCLRTRGYQRLATTTSHSGQRRRWRRRRFWRLKINPRLTLKKLKPRKLFIGLRDAYVRIMMKMANSSVVIRGRTMSTGEGFGTMALKEYDEKMIMEIYKTLAMRQQIPSQIAC